MQRRRCGFAATVKLRASCTDPPPTATRTAFRGVCLPRLLAWACTEAVRTKQRELVLGQSLADCMRELGVTSNSGGRRGERTRLWWPDTRHESDLFVKRSVGRSLLSRLQLWPLQRRLDRDTARLVRHGLNGGHVRAQQEWRDPDGGHFAEDRGDSERQPRRSRGNRPGRHDHRPDKRHLNSITSAVEEQSATTNEISRNVSEAAPAGPANSAKTVGGGHGLPGDRWGATRRWNRARALRMCTAATGIGQQVQDLGRVYPGRNLGIAHF